MKPPLNTVLIGFGRIAQSNAFEEKLSRIMPYSTHAQVLKKHPAYLWQSVVDPSQAALSDARALWGISETAASLEDLPGRELIEVAVIATPPANRLALLSKLPALKAVLVEKPLGTSEEEARAFVDYCKARKIIVQVNLLRRADKMTRCLAEGKLVETIGNIQAAFGLYGRGLLNNGVHIVDLSRMLFGEVRSVQAVADGMRFFEGPIEGDLNLSFNLTFCSGLTMSMKPLKASFYRENGLDIWGEKGRLCYLNSGFSIFVHKLKESAHQGLEKELNLETLEKLPPSLGEAFYEMYSNLASALAGDLSLFSSGESALKTAEVLEAVMRSYKEGGQTVTLEQAGLFL